MALETWDKFIYMLTADGDTSRVVSNFIVKNLPWRFGPDSTMKWNYKVQGESVLLHILDVVDR